MWNNWDTAAYSGMIAETVSVPGHDGKMVRAYYSRPLGAESCPGIVLIPHIPGWDEFNRETARRYTEHGYSVICPDIYQDFGHGRPADISAKMMSEGGARDDNVMADTKGCLDFLKAQPNANGKVGVTGMCSGGRHAYLAACTIEGFDACASGRTHRVHGAAADPASGNLRKRRPEPLEGGRRRSGGAPQSLREGVHVPAL